MAMYVVQAIWEGMLLTGEVTRSEIRADALFDSMLAENAGNVGVSVQMWRVGEGMSREVFIAD